MSDELKPCPFCGGKPYLANVEMAGCAYVVCTDCRAQGNDGSRETAVAAWNTRSVDPSAIRKAALQEAADVVREFGNAMSRIGLHPDADSLRCDAASVALIGASSAILALIEKDENHETA